ncbi:hypothetical protein [Streptomyces subrutilus]|uniref:hypothetical protein n=1 Tax=Streptomyces subrutilus TaxID=36818 RepID=UPI00340204FD
MTKKKRRARYDSPGDSIAEKKLRYMSAELREPRMVESSEISPDTARDAKVEYEIFCLSAGLSATPLGWGLLHCTVRDKRGRRKRMTLASDDLTYHRMFVEAASRRDRGEAMELAVARYPYMRPGWPGPPRQGGSWPGGDPVPWLPTYLAAIPAEDDGNHLHGLQATGPDTYREVGVFFARGPGGAKWIMIDDEPMQSASRIICPDSGVDFYVPAGVGVMPGWPFHVEPDPCACLNGK